MADLSFERGLEVLGRRARFARGALILFCIPSLGMALAVLVAGGTIDLGSPYASEQTVVYDLTIAYLLAYLICALLVAFWIHRAHANLRAANVEGLQFTPGGAIGSYFIPIANFYQPLQAMRELWRASLLDTESTQTHATSQLGFWWAAWIGGSVVGYLAGLVGDAGVAINVASQGCEIAAALLLANIIKAITEGQAGVMRVAEIFA